MVARSAEEKAQRRELAARKKAEREARKRAKDEEIKKLESVENARKAALLEKKKKQTTTTNDLSDGVCFILNIPDVNTSLIFSFLPARDLACASLTCATWNYSMGEIRIAYLKERLSSRNRKLCSSSSSREEILNILKASYGGGDTKRATTRKQRNSDNTKDCDEFMGYARFLEEGVNGYSKLSIGRENSSIMIHPCINGRYASVSPEHSLVRVGGDGYKSGPGGSGVASWGVGRRGQLGHGNERRDIGHPQRLMGGLGYGIRIVQVSAGGGLVRVAHSLFLTSSGRVLSCGTGNYGQLGLGYSKAKQLPDHTHPQYIRALDKQRIICVSAGEIHSAVVDSDGDLFTFGDGFLGQLGHGDKRPQVSPKHVESGGIEDECIVTVACGCRHTLATTEEGEVFSMGFGHFGVLGRSFTPFEYDADAALENLTGGDLDADAGFIPLPQQQDNNNNNRIQQEQIIEVLDPVLREERERAEVQAHLELIANMTLDDSSNQCIPQIVDSLKGINIIGVSAGHRHSMFLDNRGGIYTCGSGVTGALGHGDTSSQMYPMKVMEFENKDIQIMQISVGVDISMAVSTEGNVYSWGKLDGGRLGLGVSRGIEMIPTKVSIGNNKAIDVECGYVHSLIVGLDGTLKLCGGVGINGAADGQLSTTKSSDVLGKPVLIEDFNIWHRMPEPTIQKKKQERWKKYGKYELQGRSKMMTKSNNDM